MLYEVITRGKDDTYHMVWTTDWQGGSGFGYASSKDLINWSKQEYIPVMQHEPDVVNIWAPEVFYDDVEDRYIVIWASTIPFRFEKGIEEEKNNHRMYYVTTKDFKTRITSYNVCYTKLLRPWPNCQTDYCNKRD